MVRLLTSISLYSAKQILTISRSTPFWCLVKSPTHLVLKEHLPWQFWLCLTIKLPSSTSRREPRGIYLHIPQSRVRNNLTASVSPSILPQGHKALGTFLTPTSATSIVTPQLNWFSVSNSHSCTWFWL